MRLRVDLAYDGFRFHGFARQPDRPTVQGALEEALHRVCGVAVRTVGAGRTDRGVHATGQVLHADLPDTAPCLRDLGSLRKALDALCGSDISIMRVRRVPATFDARLSATQRRYRYRICDAVAISPLERHITWHAGPPRLDVVAMAEAGRLLLGEHDFSSFCRRADDRHLIRRIDELIVRRPRADLVFVVVTGPAFCHQMVRSITGCLVAVGRGRRTPEWIGEVLAARDRSAAASIAPPEGLILTGVRYGKGGRSAEGDEHDADEGNAHT